MMTPKCRYAVSFLLTVLAASAALRAVEAPKPDPAAVDPAYRKEVETWRQQRLASLKREDGWLTLVGLYWLKPGENRLGSDPGNPVILPAGKAPALAGILSREGTEVRLTVQPGVISVQGCQRES